MTRKSSFSGGRRLLAVAGPLLGLLLVLCLASPSAVPAASAPDWLSAANHVDLGHFGDGSAAVLVGEWTDFSVDVTGKYTLTERRAIRVLHVKPAQRYLTAVGYENNDSKVTSIQTWTIDSSGRVTQSGKNDVNIVAAFADYEMYSDDRAKMIQAPGAEDGALVGYEVVSQGRIPINGQAFRLERSIPIHQGELHLSVASGSMHWFSNHPDRMQVVEQSERSATIRVTDRPGIPEEPSAPPTSSLALEVVMNYDPQGASAINSWDEAGKIYHPISVPDEKPDTEIAAQVDSLVSGKTETLSKIDALYNYVSREVRYVAIEIGVGGYQPHPPADVFKNKYGDCKDKATLLMTMLGHIGLRGYPALLGTRGDVEADPKVPTLATFDHFIVALPVPASLRSAVEHFPAYDAQTQILWIDPTSEYDPLGQVPEMDQGVFALISYPDHGELRKIPEPSPLENRIHYDVRAHLQTDGTGTAEVEVKYWGTNNAERHAYYRGRSQESMRKIFENRVAHYANQAAFRQASISGVEDSRQQITEKFSFSGDFSTASTGDSWFFQPLFLSGVDVPEYGPRPRELPLDIGPPEQIQVEYAIDLPPGMKIGRIPENAKIQSEFGEADIEYSISGNLLRATQMISYTQSRIPPEKYSAFRDFVVGDMRAERLHLRVEKIVP
jgi:Domain of Unknown Function with PDB structure (DUF3857)/Transglutaminase-like superfamily/Domain of Unknown Function with PDB structure (DUF3858)